MTPSPIATSSNGIRVANFSSGHPFEFEDGTILPACEQDRVDAGSVSLKEQLELCETDTGVAYNEVTLTPTLGPDAGVMLDEFYDLPVDIVIVPLMMLEAIKHERSRIEQLCGHATGSDNRWFFCHAIRRDKRNGPICIDRFCV